MTRSIIYFGLDVHKDSITSAVLAKASDQPWSHRVNEPAGWSPLVGCIGTSSIAGPGSGSRMAPKRNARIDEAQSCTPNLISGRSHPRHSDLIGTLPPAPGTLGVLALVAQECEKRELDILERQLRGFP
jgi:hypothetical protein